MDFTAPQPAEDEGPVEVVPFPTLHPEALIGLPGKIVEAVAPHTEAHPAAILVQYLARFGATIGRGPHVRVDNREHPARLYPLIVGKTSDGAKGTSYGVVAALFAAAEGDAAATIGTRRGPLAAVRESDPLRRVSGLSSGEGLIELVRDGKGDDPSAKDFDEGVHDKRLLVIEQEFVSVLAVMDRQGSKLPGIFREAWDGDVLSTLNRNPLTATGAHIVVIGHVTPGELRLVLNGAQMLGGTLNRTLPVASRRTKLLPDGGNIPATVLDEYAGLIAGALAAAKERKEVEHTPDVLTRWRATYGHLRRGRPDGPVASILARGAPQVRRLALTYALADHSDVVDDQHMAAALAVWRYVEDTAEWMFGVEVDSGQVDALVAFIAAGGATGRTRTQISVEHYQRNKPAAEITAALGELLRDGRIRQETDSSGRGRPAVRYFTC